MKTPALALIAALAAAPAMAQGQPTYLPLKTPEVPVPVSDAAARANRPKISVKKIILVGDSTMQVNSGWGGAFCARHVASTVTCVDLGRGGRSTLSYRAEGSWDIALAEAKTPGYGEVYILIQFGHNDQPGKPGNSTDLETEFGQNLTRFVEEARAAGAIPVLVTPLTRRSFVGGSAADDIRSVLLLGKECLFLKDLPQRLRNRHSVSRHTSTPRSSRSAATRAASVGSHSRSRRASSQSRSPARTTGLRPPIGLADRLPVARHCCAHFTPVLALTSNNRAAARADIPRSNARQNRSRKSSE